MQDSVIVTYPNGFRMGIAVIESEPENPAIGAVYINKKTGKLFTYTETGWKEVI